VVSWGTTFLVAILIGASWASGKFSFDTSLSEAQQHAIPISILSVVSLFK